jgi:hypothetical protein
MSTVMPKSVLRHRPIDPNVAEWRTTLPSAPARAHQPARTSKRACLQLHPLAPVGLGMLLALFLLWVWLGIWSWGSEQLDTLRYGYPRVTQLDRRVGHEAGNTQTHFLATNDHGQIYVLEIPGGHPATSHLLVGPFLLGPDADLAPVQLVFQGNPRHPDLLIKVESTETLFLNTGTTYTPAVP